MRELSETFMNDLLSLDGSLLPILERVRHDHTLMLSIRDGYINLYYRGGNILRVSERGKGVYDAFFEKKYNTIGRAIPDLPLRIENSGDSARWVHFFPHLKEMMDFYFSVHPKSEREFQQLIARENNHSSISNESEYFIADIEFADGGIGARFDMLAIRWTARDRKAGNRCKPAFIEVKYGDGALKGNAGLVKHLGDINSFVSNKERYKELFSSMANQFNQLDKLGLLKFNKGTSNAKVELNADDKPEVIFILANHNPRSSKLGLVLEDERFVTYNHFDLRFYVASFSGYGLHTACMKSLVEFQALLQNDSKSQLGSTVNDECAVVHSATENDFMTSLDDNGREVFSHILTLAKDKAMRIHWGTKGFSLNVNVDGAHLSVIHGYPLSSRYKQSIYTTMVGRDRMTGKTAVPEDIINDLRDEAIATGLFRPAGRELKCLIGHAFTESDISALQAWIEKAAKTIEQYGLKI